MSETTSTRLPARLWALGARLPRLADLGIALGLALVTLVSRWPYRAHMLYNWDAVQFALALREFDVSKHQPHPPGYLLYVLLGRLLNAWLGDPTLAYVGLAMVFSAATTFIVFWLGKRLYDRATATAAAALLAVSPLFWFYGSVGLTYAGEAFGASLVAWYAYRALEGTPRALYLGALTLGLVGGMRQSVLILLFPLWGGCAFERATGLPCVSCGMTRSFEWFSRGRFSDALRANPLGFLLASGAVVCFAWLLAAPLRPPRLRGRLSRRGKLLALAAGVAVALANWTWLIAHPR